MKSLKSIKNIACRIQSKILLSPTLHPKGIAFSQFSFALKFHVKPPFSYPLKLSLLAFFLFLTVSSCEEEPVIQSKVCFTTYHHERIIPNTEIHVKYHAERFPGYDDRTVYDTYFDTDDNGQVCISDTPTGIHWFACFGIDTLLQEEVFGSRRINVSWAGYQLDTIIYVSE